MEVARSDAGDVAFLGFYVEQFGVDLQSFHAKDDVDAFLLHSLAPLDVALLVESGEQLYHCCYLLAVAGCGDECLYHLGVLGQAIEGGLDGFYFGLDGCLAQYTDVAVEVVIGNMDEAVFLAYLVEDALVGYELGLHDRCPLVVFQVIAATVGERHQVLVVLVSATGKRGVELFGVESVAQFSLHLTWHLVVVDDTYGISLLSAAHTQGDLFHCTKVGIVVHLHFGILGKLEAVGAVGAFLETEEDEGQAVTDDVVEIHDVVEAVAGRYLHPSSVYAVGHFDDGVFLLVVFLLAFLNDEVDAVVFQHGEVFYF